MGQRQVTVVVTLLANSDERAAEIVDQALEAHGSVLVWRIVDSDGSGEQVVERLEPDHPLAR